MVVEAGFADALGLHVGDRLRLGGNSFEVVGIAVTVAFPSYPDSLGSFLVGSLGSYSLGLVWVPEADVAQLAAVGSEPVFYYLDLKLADPAAARAFADRYTTGSSSQQTSGPSAGGGASTSATTLTLYPWQLIRSEDVKLLARAQLVLYTGSWLLALLAIASVAVLVGGRMAEQTRRVGLLKAVGATPRFVAVVLLCEHVLVGLCAAGSRAAGRMACGAVDRRAGSGPPRRPESPVAHRLLGRSGGRAGARGGGRGDVRAGDPRRAPEHGGGAGRLGPRAATQVSSDRAIGPPAGHPPARRAACRSSSVAAAAERVQRRRDGERSRCRADRQDDRRGCVPRPPSDSGHHHHLGHARRPGRDQRRLHRLEQRARRTTSGRACPCPGSHAAAKSPSACPRRSRFQPSSERCSASRAGS